MGPGLRGRADAGSRLLEDLRAAAERVDALQAALERAGRERDLLVHRAMHEHAASPDEIAAAGRVTPHRVRQLARERVGRLLGLS